MNNTAPSYGLFLMILLRGIGKFVIITILQNKTPSRIPNTFDVLKNSNYVSSCPQPRREDPQSDQRSRNFQSMSSKKSVQEDEIKKRIGTLPASHPYFPRNNPLFAGAKKCTKNKKRTQNQTNIRLQSIIQPKSV